MGNEDVAGLQAQNLGARSQTRFCSEYVCGVISVHYAGCYCHGSRPDL